MNEFQKRRQMQSQQQYPGCMGRMIGMPRTKLLTDRAHRDASPTRRNQSNLVNKALDPVGVPIRDKSMVRELKKSSSDKKSCGTPMKMLIAQEMSKETESSQKPPGVVAKLMGLDALPAQQLLPTRQKSLREGFLHNASEDFGSLLTSRSLSHAHEKEYKDVYEVRQQPSRVNGIRDQPQWRGRPNAHSDEKRMALVRQKFTEAKRLATDKSFLQSKEFQDALEVLSSNRDLFLKFLEEPNSLLSKHLNEINNTPSSGQTRRITVLKPSNAVETKAVNQLKMQQCLALEEDIWDKDKHCQCSSLDRLETRNLSHPTRIVVLKPSPGKPCEFKTLATNRIFSPKLLEDKDLYRDLKTQEIIGSGEITEEITQQMQESMSNRRDDSLLSSVLSNGYVGDESSFNRSEHEYVEEASVNLSDSEIVTPTSRHSLDINRMGSPFSFSSFSRSSYSPESSVICEAKKRLSERWASMASKGVNLENMQVRRSSSTLGEMLAIPEVKKEEESSRELDVSSSSMSSGGGEDLRTSTACLSITEAKDGANGDASPRNFSRSKSVPVSSTYEKVELNVKVTKSTSIKATTPKEEMKSKSGKTSFKGKVSSFFFSRNKKPSQEKSNPSSLAASDVSFQSGNREIACKKDDISKGVHISGPEERPVNPEENSSKGSLPSATVNSGAINSTASAKVAPSLEKFSVSETPSETHEQPSPVSVLEAPFADEASNSMLQSSQSLHAGHLQTLSRSAPIESIARSLSWDDTYKEVSSENPLKLTRAGTKADEEEQEHFNFVQKLLLSAGLDNGSSKNIFSRWHSLDCPLDQTLLNRFLDQKEEETKCKAKRSNQRLLFDCVNATLLEIGQASIYNAYPHPRSFEETQKDAPAGTSVAEVWKFMRDKNSAEGKYSRETGNINVLVDQVVSKEVVGREWTELLWWEFDKISKEVGTKVLEELIGETLSDLTNPCL